MTRVSGAKAWPPLWVHLRGAAFGKPRGEIGTLTKVERHNAIANGLFLWIEDKGEVFIGMMHFDDPLFCDQIHGVLGQNIGRPICEIGNIDLPLHTPD